MGLIIRNIHGKDFLVYLKEKEQIYLGPKGEYEKGKLKKINDVIKHNDKKTDQILKKYVDDTIELSLYMPESERKEYLSKRTAELLARLRRLEELQKVKSDSKIELETNHTIKKLISEPSVISFLDATKLARMLNKWVRQRIDVKQLLESVLHKIEEGGGIASEIQLEGDIGWSEVSERRSFGTFPDKKEKDVIRYKIAYILYVVKSNVITAHKIKDEPKSFKLEITTTIDPENVPQRPLRELITYVHTRDSKKLDFIINGVSAFLMVHDSVMPTLRITNESELVGYLIDNNVKVKVTDKPPSRQFKEIILQYQNQIELHKKPKERETFKISTIKISEKLRNVLEGKIGI